MLTRISHLMNYDIIIVKTITKSGSYYHVFLVFQNSRPSNPSSHFANSGPSELVSGKTKLTSEEIQIKTSTPPYGRITKNIHPHHFFYSGVICRFFFMESFSAWLESIICSVVSKRDTYRLLSIFQSFGGECCYIAPDVLRVSEVLRLINGTK